MMHPAIEQTMSTGYPYSEPLVYEECSCCGEEIHFSDEFVEHAGYPYCTKECLAEQMIKEGNANLLIAE